MSRQPRRARCHAIALPTIPAPMTTTLARSGSAAMCLLQFRVHSRISLSCRPSPATMSAEIHHDRLELGQALDREPPADPPEAALRSRAAPERQVRLPVVRAFVDVDPSGASRLGKTQAPREVTGEDAREQAVG